MVRLSIEQAYQPQQLCIYQKDLNPPAPHEIVNPLSRTFTGSSPATSLSSPDLMNSLLAPGGTTLRRARRKAKEWSAPKIGSFPWTDVRRTQGFKQFAEPPRCVVSWDAYRGGPTEAPIHTLLEKGNRTKYKDPSQYTRRATRLPVNQSSQRPLSGDSAFLEAPRGRDTASRQRQRRLNGGRPLQDGTAINGGHFPDRPGTADSLTSARSEILSRASARDAGLGSRGGSRGSRRSQPAPWDMLEFLESVERKARQSSIRPSSAEGGPGGRPSFGGTMSTSLGDSHGSMSGLARSPSASSRMSLPARPSTSGGFTTTGSLSFGRDGMTGQFDPERVVILGNVPVTTESADLAAEMGAKFGALCYCSIQPDDSGGPIGWAIVTFDEHGPAASATARGSVTLTVSTGPPEEFGLDAPKGNDMTETCVISIDKLAFKMAEATAAETMQQRDAFKSYTRSISILLSIRNVLLAGKISVRQGRPMTTATINAAVNGRVGGMTAAKKLQQDQQSRAKARAMAGSRFLSHNIDN